MQTALSRVALAYLAAWAAAWIAGLAASGSGWSPVAVAFVADVVATCVIFAFSLAHDNSSFYDPYWSVAPLPIAVYWAIDGAWANGARQALVLTAVAVWGVRLTYSWVRGWRGLAHEDWRYVDLRARTGRHYWPVSFVGLHLAPTLVVFLGLLSLRSALASPAPLGPLDAVAFAVTGAALWLEARGDEELRRHRDAGPGAEEILRSGVWAWCRHPNYLGRWGSGGDSGSSASPRTRPGSGRSWDRSRSPPCSSG